MSISALTARIDPQAAGEGASDQDLQGVIGRGAVIADQVNVVEAESEAVALRGRILFSRATAAWNCVRRAVSPAKLLAGAGRLAGDTEVADS